MTTPSISSGSPSPAGRRRGRSLAAVADAVGHCVLVFAFVPPLAALGPWLAFEARNRHKLADPLVLVMTPLRGAFRVLEAFGDEVPSRLAAGVLAGLLLSAWAVVRGRAPLVAARGAGAVCGVVATGVAVVLGGLLGRDAALAGSHVAVALGAGVVCGMLAAPGAARLLAPDRAGDRDTTHAAPETIVDDQGSGSSSSASQ